MKKLSDSEFEIMKILWSRGTPMTSNGILDEMKGQRDWKLASLMTVLARMVEKGYVYCDRSTRTNYYSAVVGEEQYKVEESEQFLDRLFNKSATKLIASLYQGKKFSAEEIDELRTYLDTLEEKNQ
ncbi:MAG: BlaI/MecI/CopY family transcriptional regulator [Lachnospiraceae bacterium]|nr:BlaI/MecI/CopY family transcriptional regulator [Lachnospiraceae bacterium]MDE7272765.1 BlaI/MecI/CopY family transcriptional regulator [Lachnospiraceae bacterium]